MGYDYDTLPAYVDTLSEEEAGYILENLESPRDDGMRQSSLPRGIS